LNVNVDVDAFVVGREVNGGNGCMRAFGKGSTIVGEAVVGKLKDGAMRSFAVVNEEGLSSDTRQGLPT
jgi:hypothetical protein